MNKNLLYLITGLVIGIIATYIIVTITGSTSQVESVEVLKEHSEHIEQQLINIPEETMKEFGIEVQTAGSGKILKHTDLTGEIVPNPYKVAHIVPRFAGVVKAVYKKIGDFVKKGDKIAEIESNESLVKYDVTSSIDGTILELHMTPGELIGDQSHIVMIADLNSVWAELNVYQKDLGEVKTGQKVEIVSPHTETNFTGKIFYISPVVDEATRTAIARVKLGNSRGIWKPGMFISAKVFTSYKTVDIAVPKYAVQILNGQKIIFVKEGNGFRPQAVTIGLENEEKVEILDGLHDGDNFISKGAYIFKSEILKESFGGDEH